MREMMRFLYKITSRLITQPEKAPVVFGIHGGGFTIGAGNMPYASFRPTVAYGNAIVVTMNYRLGVFGFLTTGKSCYICQCYHLISEISKNEYR